MSNPSEITQDLRNWWSGLESGEIIPIENPSLISEYIPIMYPGHIMVISGYTSSGKSTFLSQLIAHYSGILNKKTLVFSVEDSRTEKLMGLASVVSNVHKHKMLTGNMNGSRAAVEAALENINLWPISIYDNIYTTREMEKSIIEEKPEVVVIDYAQNVHGDGEIYKKMSAFASWVQFTANTYKPVMIVASQIDNVSAKDPNSPIMEAKGGGELPAISTYFLLIRKGREEGKWGLVEIHIKKQKWGPCAVIKAEFNDTWTAIHAVDKYGSTIVSRRSGDD